MLGGNMSCKLWKKIAYILIVSSFFFFAIASYIEISEEKLSGTKQIISGDININEKPDEELANINDTDESTTESNNSTQTNPNNSTTTSKTNQTPKSNTGNNNSSTKNNNGNSTKSNNSTSTPSTNTPPASTYTPPTQTYVDPNNQLRLNIENQYNVNVIYGSETNSYTVGGMTTTAITDSNKISSSLNSLKSCLSKYPANMFNEIHSMYPLNIYLIDRYSTANVTGVTDSTNRTVNISIATAYPFDVSLHHELYHYIEHYMFARGASYNTWNSLNPSGFTYGNVNSRLAYSQTLSADSYFVNEYAMYSAAEDRASTFEYMTASSKASCLNNGKPVYLKAKYMAQTMEYYVNSVSSSTTEFWERFL